MSELWSSMYIGRHVKYLLTFKNRGSYI